MRALLDTHVWLWLLGDSKRIKPRALGRLTTADDLVLSAVSIWEVVVKDALRKVALPLPIGDLLALSRDGMGVRVLPVEAGHALGLQQLPLLHRDPFDRMLVSQARVEGLQLVSADPSIAAYDVELFDPT